MKKKSIIASVLVASMAMGALTGCGSSSDSATISDEGTATSSEEVVFQTYGMPDNWANWGGIFEKFCEAEGITRSDTDMSSAEEIEKFLAEKDNPQANIADIGMIWGPVAKDQGVTYEYKNENWDLLPDWAKDEDGDWFGTYVGVPVFLVNTDLVENVPTSWADLLKPEYKDQIVMANPMTSGTGQNTVLAAAYALGGDISDIDTAVEYFNELDNMGNLKDADDSAALYEKGELPIVILYDLNALSWSKEFANEINSEIVFPEEGSIYAPSALMINKWCPEPELAEKFADYITSDEGQKLLAEGGARPIRTVAGNLELTEEESANLLPDSFYGNCGVPENWDSVSPELIAEKWQSEVLDK